MVWRLQPNATHRCHVDVWSSHPTCSQLRDPRVFLMQGSETLAQDPGLSLEYRCCLLRLGKCPLLGHHTSKNVKHVGTSSPLSYWKGISVKSRLFLHKTVPSSEFCTAHLTLSSATPAGCGWTRSPAVLEFQRASGGCRDKIPHELKAAGLYFSHSCKSKSKVPALLVPGTVRAPTLIKA